MDTKRSGFVRTTNSGVYKGVEARPGRHIEYETAPGASTLIRLIVFIALIAAAGWFASVVMAI